MTLEEAKKIIKSECYIADLLNLDRTRMVNTALDMAIKALGSWDKYSDELWEKAYKRGYDDGVDAYAKHIGLCEEEGSISRWIPVSERLPDTDDEVLCWYEYYHWSRGKVLPEYGLGYYLGSTSTWCGEVANGRDVRVIAWMPIQPYKAEGSDNK